MMLVIGSRALQHAGLIQQEDIKNSDWDFIADEETWYEFKAKMLGAEVEVKNPDVRAFKCMHNGKETYFEAYIVKDWGNHNILDSSDLLLEYADENIKKDNLTGFHWATPDMCLAIKMSHRYKKNTPFFRKTMYHIRFLVKSGIKLNVKLLDIMKKREEETLNYGHPVLNTTKDEFFKDDIYTYDHDTIHETVALLDKPAYTFYMKDGSQVMTSKEKFIALPDEIKLAGVYEESCVLALERSQIPNDFNVDPEKSFKMALEKVCTSITSGWFREFAYSNYDNILLMYNTLGKNDYVNRFKANQHLLKPFTRG